MTPPAETTTDLRGASVAINIRLLRSGTVIRDWFLHLCRRRYLRINVLEMLMEMIEHSSPGVASSFGIINCRSRIVEEGVVGIVAHDCNW